MNILTTIQQVLQSSKSSIEIFLNSIKGKKIYVLSISYQFRKWVKQQGVTFLHAEPERFAGYCYPSQENLEYSKQNAKEFETFVADKKIGWSYEKQNVTLMEAEIVDFRENSYDDCETKNDFIMTVKFDDGTTAEICSEVFEVPLYFIQ